MRVRLIYKRHNRYGTDQITTETLENCGGWQVENGVLNVYDPKKGLAMSLPPGRWLHIERLDD